MTKELQTSPTLSGICTLDQCEWLGNNCTRPAGDRSASTDLPRLVPSSPSPHILDCIASATSRRSLQYWAQISSELTEDGSAAALVVRSSPWLPALVATGESSPPITRLTGRSHQLNAFWKQAETCIGLLEPKASDSST